MTREEAIKILKSKMDGKTDTSYEWCECVRMAIEALEQESCEDCISRQVAIDELKDMYHAAEKWEKEASDDVIKARAESCMTSLIEMKLRIEKLPSAQPEQRWIPVSERLPEEEEKSYWVCLDGGGQCQCRWTNSVYGCGANEWNKWGWHIMDKPQYSRVIAWMPLPKIYESYKEESEVNLIER